MERRQTYRSEKSVVKILKRALLSVTVLCNEEKLLQCWVFGNYPGARHLQSYFVPSHHGAFGNLRGLSPGHLPSKAQKGEGEGEREKNAKGKRDHLSPIPPLVMCQPGSCKSSYRCRCFETFASVYKHHNHFNHFKSKVIILWRTSLWFDI